VLLPIWLGCNTPFLVVWTGSAQRNLPVARAAPPYNVMAPAALGSKSHPEKIISVQQYTNSMKDTPLNPLWVRR